MKVHVACVIAENSIRMGGAIVEQLSDGFSSGFSAFGLGGGKRSQGNKHGGINGARRRNIGGYQSPHGGG